MWAVAFSKALTRDVLEVNANCLAQRSFDCGGPPVRPAWRDAHAYKMRHANPNERSAVRRCDATQCRCRARDRIGKLVRFLPISTPPHLVGCSRQCLSSQCISCRAPMWTAPSLVSRIFDASQPSFGRLSSKCAAAQHRLTASDLWQMCVVRVQCKAHGHGSDAS